MANKPTLIYSNEWTGVEIIQHTVGQRKFVVWDRDKNREICICFTEESARQIALALLKSAFA